MKMPDITKLTAIPGRRSALVHQGPERILSRLHNVKRMEVFDLYEADTNAWLGTYTATSDGFINEHNVGCVDAEKHT